MWMKKVFYGDFETTQVDADNIVEVYLWAVVRGKKVWSGEDITSFMNFCEKNKGIIYFHNLKFDFSYVHYYLIEHNIEYSLLEKKGTIYSVKFYEVELRDSLNFMPMTLREVGLNYCTRYAKTSIDYNVGRGHKPTPEEVEYCINDCRVLEEGLTNYLATIEVVLGSCGAIESADKVKKKLTNAGIAFEAFKELSDFDRLCPKTTRNEYELFRAAYKGGYVYSRPCGIVEDVQMIDCNSMYPFMYSTIDMPFGHPIICKDFEELQRFNFYIVKIYACYELREGFIPIIGGGVGRYGGVTYESSSFGEYKELTLCSTDFELIKHFYDIDYVFIWGCGFQTKPEFFKSYADTFIEVKNREKGMKRAVAKVLLNSPYGKTAMNGLNELKQYSIDEKYHIVSSSVCGYEFDENVYQYLPIAIAITASARKYLLETAEKIGFENVYYMDTDSIKFKSCETDITYDPNILGMWKDEGRVELFKTISPKKYVYWGIKQTDGSNDETIYFTCAGFNKSVLSCEMYHGKKVERKKAIELMNLFSQGLELSCLQSRLVRGGRALMEVKKKVK